MTELNSTRLYGCLQAACIWKRSLAGVIYISFSTQQGVHKKRLMLAPYVLGEKADYPTARRTFILTRMEKRKVILKQYSNLVRS